MPPQQHHGTFLFYLYTTKTPLAYIAQLHSHSAMLHNRIVTPFTAYKLMGERAHSHHRSRHLDPLGINCRSIAQFKLRRNSSTIPRHITAVFLTVREYLHLSQPLILRAYRLELPTFASLSSTYKYDALTNCANGAHAVVIYHVFSSTCSCLTDVLETGKITKCKMRWCPVGKSMHRKASQLFSSHKNYTLIVIADYTLHS
ncbi:hypothetical protein DINM_004395 [Dirofilaria immitis]|nr:hypothetical protein [Dirofilaria immitis]